ncbi:MAG: TIGR00266 family protein [Bdellovibrionaceae bacterium]|nr:TIGR00266 family protein [Pseudobdellovibrionaceae bacterium]
MDVKIRGGKAFGFLRVKLQPRELIIAESGAMASKDCAIELRSKFNGGGFIKALLLRFLGKESLFINEFINESGQERHIVLSQPTPGEIIEVELNNETLFIQPGAYMASTAGIKYKISWAGISSFLAREGLFRLRLFGTGQVWYGAYGAVIETEVVGHYIVDSGHLLSYPPNITLKAQLSGGIFSSFFSGEGIVLRLEGRGKIKLQTRSVGGLAGWLNPRFWS